MICGITIAACHNSTPFATYDVCNAFEDSCIYIENWNVTGPFTPQQDSIILHSNKGDFAHITWTANPDTTVKVWHNGCYHPLYGQLDLREVFAIAVTDTTTVIDTLITYLSCSINAAAPKKVYLTVNTEMEHTVYLNGDTLADIGADNILVYPIFLKSGDNTLSVRVNHKPKAYV